MAEAHFALREIQEARNKEISLFKWLTNSDQALLNLLALPLVSPFPLLYHNMGGVRDSSRYPNKVLARQKTRGGKTSNSPLLVKWITSA